MIKFCTISFISLQAIKKEELAKQRDMLQFLDDDDDNDENNEPKSLADRLGTKALSKPGEILVQSRYYSTVIPHYAGESGNVTLPPPIPKYCSEHYLTLHIRAPAVLHGLGAGWPSFRRMPNIQHRSIINTCDEMHSRREVSLLNLSSLQAAQGQLQKRSSNTNLLNIVRLTKKVVR